jgi:hypothetical protein
VTFVTGSFYGPEEDMAHTHVLSVVTGPAANHMRITLDEASPSNDNTFRIHSALLAFLRAYLPHRAVEEWRVSQSAFRWGDTFPGSWAGVVCLDDLHDAISALTKDDPLHVKRLLLGGWSDSCILSWMRDPCGSNGRCTRIKPTT